MGPGGATGLRYESFREVRIAQRVRAADWPVLFEAIRAMESAALKAMRPDEIDEDSP